MRTPRCRYLLGVCFLAAQLAAAASAFCQEPAKPDAPEPKGPPHHQKLTVLTANAPYEAITGKQRIEWAAQETFGPQSWLMGTFTAAIGTAKDHPAAYGPHWEGFAKRYGVRFSGIATSNTLEGGLGAIWGEDPRYLRKPGQGFKRRFVNVFVGSFTARDREGKIMPAYARYIAIPGNNFLSNTWRVSGEADTSSALIRTGYGVLARVASDAWAEFWPDVKRKVFTR